MRALSATRTFAWLVFKRAGLPGAVFAAALVGGLIGLLWGAAGSGPGERAWVLQALLIPFIEGLSSLLGVILAARIVRAEDPRRRLWLAHPIPRGSWLWGKVLGAWLSVGLWMASALGTLWLACALAEPGGPPAGPRIASAGATRSIAQVRRRSRSSPPSAVIGLGAAGLAGAEVETPRILELGPGEAGTWVFTEAQPLGPEQPRLLRLHARAVSQALEGARSPLNPDALVLARLRWHRGAAQVEEELALLSDAPSLIPVPALSGEGPLMLRLENADRLGLLIFPSGAGRLPVELVTPESGRAGSLARSWWLLWWALGILMTTAAALSLVMRPESASVLVLLLAMLAALAPEWQAAAATAPPQGAALHALLAGANAIASLPPSTLSLEVGQLVQQGQPISGALVREQALHAGLWMILALAAGGLIASRQEDPR